MPFSSGSIGELDVGHRTQLHRTPIEPQKVQNSEVMEMQVEQGKRSGAPDRTAVIVVGVVLALLLVGLLGGGMMMGPGMMVAGPLLVVAAVLLVVWLVGGGRLPGTDAVAGSPGGDGAQAILRERYARGELTREQYEQMRRDLG
jgi:putative membrane protein